MVALTTIGQTDEKMLAYTRHEPIGVVGQIIPCTSRHPMLHRLLS